MANEKLKQCTVYIDEAGDLGVNKGTQWFVLSAVIIDMEDEKNIRTNMAQIKKTLNVNEIHIRNIKEFKRRAYVVRELNKENFTYVNVLIDTGKPNNTLGSLTAYNYACRMLLERVSWFLRDTKRRGDIVLSSRGTSRDGELITYITDKLFNYEKNEVYSACFGRVLSKSATKWDMLQLADVCATTMFLSYEIDRFGFNYPCFSKTLFSHLYAHNNNLMHYGIKYFSSDMQPDPNELKRHNVCVKII